MKKLRIAGFVLSLCALSVTPLHAQSNSGKPIELDHTTVFVRDIQKSGEFYEKVIGLERIPNPFKDGRHIWFRTGPHSQLHVVGGATETATSDIEVHMAFRVASVPDFTAHLDQLHMQYRNLKGDGKTSVRVDGVHQIYFQDPDGYWIEVNDDRF
jgi:lactoylglutathione lyase